MLSPEEIARAIERDQPPIDTGRIDVARRKPPAAPTDAEEFRVREQHLLRTHADLAFKVLFEGGSAPNGIRAPRTTEGAADIPEFVRTGQRDVYEWSPRERKAKIFLKVLPKAKATKTPLLDEVPHESPVYADYFPVGLALHEYAHHVFGRDLASRIVELKKGKSSRDVDLAARLEVAQDHQWFRANEELFCDLTAVLYTGDGAAVSKSIKASYGTDAPMRDFTVDHPLRKVVSAEHDRLAPVRSWIGKKLLKSKLSEAEILRRVHKVLIEHASDVMRSPAAKFYDRVKPQEQNQELLDRLATEFADVP